jgi:NTP pyrophosphatase (non-canonical NTP hydrolase)
MSASQDDIMRMWCTDFLTRIDAINAWLDTSNIGRIPPEIDDASRIIKLMEESGEVAQAWIGYTGQNPRKGKTHTRDDVRDELADVAVTALCAARHFSENEYAFRMAMLNPPMVADVHADHGWRSDLPSVIAQIGSEIGAANRAWLIRDNGYGSNESEVIARLCEVSITALWAVGLLSDSQSAWRQILNAKLMHIINRSAVPMHTADTACEIRPYHLPCHAAMSDTLRCERIQEVMQLMRLASIGHDCDTRCVYGCILGE